MISLLHPSRGRPRKSLDNCITWGQVCSERADVELILSLDSSDPALSEYLRLYDLFKGKVVIEDNSCVVEATNQAAKNAAGDILLYLSDDFLPFHQWDVTVVNEFKKYSGPVVLKVDDMLQPFHTQIITCPIMNREAFQLLGYFYHPGYKSMFVDEHLYHRAKKLGILKLAPHLKFEHCHVSVGKAKDDETYRRSAANWNQGKALFAKHKAAGFIE